MLLGCCWQPCVPAHHRRRRPGLRACGLPSPVLSDGMRSERCLPHILHSSDSTFIADPSFTGRPSRIWSGSDTSTAVLRILRRQIKPREHGRRCQPTARAHSVRGTQARQQGEYYE